MTSDEFEDLAKFLSFLKEKYPDPSSPKTIAQNIGLDENNVKAIAENALLNEWVDLVLRTRAEVSIKINRSGNNKLNRLTDKEDPLPSQSNVTNLTVTGGNVNIGKNNKINLDNTTKVNSDNTTKVNSDNQFINHLSDKQRKMFILGIITIFVMISIAVFASLEPNMTKMTENSLESKNTPTETTVIEPEVDKKNLPEHQRIIQSYETGKPFSIIIQGCNLHTEQNDASIKYEISLDPQILDKKGDVVNIPFNSSYQITPEAIIGVAPYGVTLNSIQVSKYTINSSGDGRVTFDITKSLFDAKHMNALGVNLFFDEIAITPYSDITDSNILPYQKVLEDIKFFELVYLPTLDEWMEPGNKQEICLG